MKKSFTDIIDGLPPEELDLLLDGVEEKGDEVSSARIHKLVRGRMPHEKKKSAAMRRSPGRLKRVIAAALAVLTALAAGTFVYAAEAKEYKEATMFFSENGLNTAGLSRTEIKAVYRDITTESFTYDKTGNILAVVDNSAISADVLEYAKGEGMAFMKEFMKRPGNGYLEDNNLPEEGKKEGVYFSSAEQIDALTLGQGYRLSYIKTVPEERGNTINESTDLSDIWLFSLDSSSGPAVYFGVTREAEGKLSYFGAISARNLSTAFSIMKTLAVKEGVSFEPVLIEADFEYVVAQSFNGDERIIVVPSDAFRLDDSYLFVKWYGQLPTYKDFLAAYTESFMPYIDPETGEPIDFSKVPCGGGGSGSPTSILPDLSIKAPEKAPKRDAAFSAILPIAAAVLIAAVLFFIVRKKRQNKV